MEPYALDCFRRAAGIAKECREWAVDTIRPEVQIRTVLEGIEERIRERGGAPGFPAQSSRNSIAAHFCTSPDDDIAYQEGDCVKVDLGVHVDGYVADTAASVDLSSDGRWQALIRASADALAAAISTVEVGISVSKIGGAVERR